MSRLHNIVDIDKYKDTNYQLRGLVNANVMEEYLKTSFRPFRMQREIIITQYNKFWITLPDLVGQMVLVPTWAVSF